MNKGILIFGGVNPRAIIAFMRKAKQWAIPFHIAAKDTSDELFLTDYASSIFYVRKDSILSLQLFRELFELLHQKYAYDGVIVLPSTEFLNRFCLTNKAELESIGYTIPLVAQEIYSLVSDKSSFSTYCNNQGLLVPSEFEELPEFYPIVAKPKRFAIEAPDLKPFLILNEQDKERFKQKYAFNLSEFYFQEYIHGESHYLLYYFSRNNGVQKASQENYIQQGNGASIIYARSTALWQTPIAEEYERLFKSMNFTGFSMIELRKRGKEYVMIECNPRLWGPLQLSNDCNSGIVELFLIDMGFNQVELPHKVPVTDIVYFWHEGFRQAQRQLGLSFHHFSPESFERERSLLLQLDLYNRPDTANLFMHD